VTSYWQRRYCLSAELAGASEGRRVGLSGYDADSKALTSWIRNDRQMAVRVLLYSQARMRVRELLCPSEV
jgi:hypothetical protein